MTLNINRGAWAGTLSFDPETRTTQGGQTLCKTGLLITDSWTDRSTGEVKESKVVVKLLAWGEMADKLAACSKGDNLYVEGALKGDKKKDDSWETVVSVRFLQVVSAPSEPAAPAKSAGARKAQQEFGDESCPF